MCLWFSHWNDRERNQFIRVVLLPKVVPHKLFVQCSALCLDERNRSTCTAADIQVDRFWQQVAEFERLFADWDVTTRNTFCHRLEEIDPIVMNHFSELIAQTVGEP
jgi:hypothetical protein